MTTRPREGLESLAIPLIPGAAILVITFVLFQGLAERQLSMVTGLVAGEAGRVQLEVTHELDLRAAAIERLAATRAEGGEAWAGEAAMLVDGDLHFQSVIACDTSLAFVQAVPEEARLLSALDPRDDEQRLTSLRVATGTLGREAVVVTTSPLANGERQLLVCAPVIHLGRRAGWVVGTMRIRELLDGALGRTLQAGFSAGVLEGPTLIHGARDRDGGPGARFAREAAVLRGPLLWTVEVWPADELAKSLKLQAPVIVFFTGMLLAFFVSMSVHLARVARAAETGAAPVSEPDAVPRGD